MKPDLTNLGYIPLDKSWIIRMGALDLINGLGQETLQFLKYQTQLSDDLVALRRAITAWESGDPIDVGESATLYRFLKFASWRLGFKKDFIVRGSLRRRQICDDPRIIDLSLSELLKLDDGTSQWVSAAVILGNKERVSSPPYKLRLTYEAVSHWQERRMQNKMWEVRYDETILRQATAFLELLKIGKTIFVPQQAEDYCFARAFGFIRKEDGESRWPNLRGHESNRLEEMEKVLVDADLGEEINSTDHRVLQAIAMRQKYKNRKIRIKHPIAVTKGWPQFWQFLGDAKELSKKIFPS